MSTNVYGSAITEETLRQIPPYDDPSYNITKFDLSKVALDMINSESKLDKARAYLKGLEDHYGHRNGVATKGLIYNATGETMTFITHHDYAGHFGDSMPPTEIHNGQWGVFFHQKRDYIPGASEGAVVYRLSSIDCMMSWWSRYAGQNHCYSELRNIGHFDDTVWGVVEDKMWKVDENKWTERNYPTEVDITMGDTSICECCAVVKLYK